MARLDEVNKDDIKENEWYVVGGGYGTIEEAKAYAKAMHISPKKIQIIGKGGYYILQRGKDLSMWTMITGGVREY